MHAPLGLLLLALAAPASAQVARAEVRGVLVGSEAARQVQWLDGTVDRTLRITSVRSRPGRVAAFGGGSHAAVALEAVGGSPAAIGIFDGATGRLLRDVPLVGAEGEGLGSAVALLDAPGAEVPSCLLTASDSTSLLLLRADGTLEVAADLGERGAAALAPGPRPGTVLALLPATGTLAEVDLDAGRALRTLDVGAGSSLLAVDPGARRAWVANPASRAASSVDLGSFQRVAQFGMGASPTDLVFSADGRQVLVTHAAAGTLTAYDARTGRVIKEAFLGRATAGQIEARPVRGEAAHTRGVDPGDLALSQDGRLLLVVARRTHELLVLDPVTLAVLGHRPVAAGPAGLAIVSGADRP